MNESVEKMSFRDGVSFKKLGASRRRADTSTSYRDNR
jgi:hypothetical protein